jgi:hypothetical protein
MSGELKIVTTAGNEMEAALVCGRLADAGIRSMQQLANSGAGGRIGGGGPRDIYVAAEGLDLARSTLGLDDASQGGPLNAETGPPTHRDVV